MAKAKDVFKFDEQFADIQTTQRALTELSESAADCADRLSSVLTELGARLDGCPGTLNSYNNVNRRLNLIKKRLKEDQELYLMQVNIERGQYPACR